METMPVEKNKIEFKLVDDMSGFLDISHLLKILTNDYSVSKRNYLIQLEQEGKVPTAHRKKRGKVYSRVWPVGDLRYLNRYFKWLDKPKNQIVISTYAPKGGVLKTTFTYNLARALALCGIKTIVIGLDSQMSISSLCEKSEEINDLSQYVDTNNIGLFHFFEIGNCKIQDLIKKTDLEFLDYIAESDDLDRMSLAFGTKRRGEYQIKEKLIPEMKDYDVILFDNAPSYSTLSISSIIAADVLITPLGCELEAFKAVQSSLEKLSIGIKEYGLDKIKRLFIATKLDNSNISKQIFYDYQNNFKGLILADAIKSFVVGQEASYNKKSIFEHKPDSELATDYHKIIKELWIKILE